MYGKRIQGAVDFVSIVGVAMYYLVVGVGGTASHGTIADYLGATLVFVVIFRDR